MAPAFLIIFLFVINNCYASFKITLKVDNYKSGLKSYLVNQLNGLNFSSVVDSSLADANGVFIFKGNVEKPEQMDIFFSDTKKITFSTPVISLFVENSNITISANLNDIPSYQSLLRGDYAYSSINVTGSSSQTLFLDYYDERSLYQTNLALLKQKYFAYLKSLDDTGFNKSSKSGSIAKGISLIQPIDSLNAAFREFLVKFIVQNKKSPVVLLIAQKNINIFLRSEADTILNALMFNQHPSNEMNEFQKNIEDHNKTALGAKYPDYLLEDTLGAKVALSKFISGRKKYVLLEFWASWCVPCRKDIPHLKIAYNLYKSSGFDVIAISVDDNKQNWKKAIKEDSTVWLHLIDPNGFQHNDLLGLYHIRSVPADILISPDGEIVDLNLRESWLDRHLMELFGNRFGSL